ncbi:hypothetical protein ABIA39_008557 [Nocardia sp. GAS34]|uniref:hypothetical protein n=1 Tax=unclassified Nocardia TaxID=2637762 RepID=UPI003D1A49C7
MLNPKVAEIIAAAARRLECLDAATDNIALRIRRTGSTLRSVYAERQHLDMEIADLIGGLPANAEFGGSRTLLDRLEHDLPGTEDVFYRDLRDYVRQHEMRAEMREESSESAQWLANRTWGRAIQIKQDYLRRQGVTGRAYAQAMWEWKDRLERAARRDGDPLPFSPEIAGREPYMREVYRADGRPRDVAFEQGFRSWSDTSDGPDPSLVNLDPGEEDKIFTSKNPAVAAGFAAVREGREAYVIQDARNYTDMNDRYGPDYPAGGLDEVTFPDVPPDKVKGMLINRYDPSAGLIPNPNFKPYEPTPTRPPREDGD